MCIHLYLLSAQNTKYKFILMSECICDVIWEYRAIFAEINKIILKLLCFSLFYINF